MKEKLIECKVCGKEIARNAKVCPNCGAKNKVPIYKKIWFWIILVLLVIGFSSPSDNTKNNSSNLKYEKSKAVTVTVLDMSTMTEADIDKWADDNKINVEIKYEYSDTIENGGFISQSVAADQNVYEGDLLTITYSLGKEPTIGQKNALKKAESYSNMMHMSKNGVYKQLISEYGEGFTEEEAQYAIDNMNADWNANALEKAKSYQEMMNMSKSAIYKQLVSEYGEDFTEEEAQYAIEHLDD